MENQVFNHFFQYFITSFILLQKATTDNKRGDNPVGHRLSFISIYVVYFYCTPEVVTSDEIFFTKPCSTAPGPTSIKVSAPAAIMF